MPKWKAILLSIFSGVEDGVDRVLGNLRRKLFRMGPVTIVPYLGHGTQRVLYIHGRALENFKPISALETDSIWKNILSFLQRFQTREIRKARVMMRLGSVEQEVQADKEGYIQATLMLPEPLPPNQIWHTVELQLVDYPDSTPTKCQVLVPPPDAQFGVISDLDDTVIRTDVLHMLKMVRNTFLGNSRTRLPFAGAAEFYQALQKGTGSTYNPIYYVSSSAWNLYDLFTDFFAVRGIPIGPLFLNDVGLSPTYFIRPGHLEHKFKVIEMLLATHPNLPFLLIGDSSEKDPLVYLQVVQNHPGRIKTVYIRDVAEGRRDIPINRVAELMQKGGSELVLVRDTVGAAVHAAEKGYINPEALPAIRQERREDKQPPLPSESVLDVVKDT